METSSGTNRIDGLGERQLYRTAYLSAVDFGGHHGAEGADIEEVFTHPRGNVAGFGFVFWQFFGFRFNAKCFISAFVLQV